MRALCPHCNRPVKMNVSIELSELTDGPTDKDWKSHLSETQISFVKEAESLGLIRAYSEAVLPTRQPGEVPKSWERHFLGFFSKAVPKQIPAPTLNHFIREFYPERISVFGAEGVVAVLAGNVLKRFVPYEILVGKGIPGAKGKRLGLNMERFEEWNKTRHGYVAGRGPAFDTMKQRSRGDFAKLVQ